MKFAYFLPAPAPVPAPVPVVHRGKDNSPHSELSLQMRHIILHHHIFKNAGSSLDSSLAAQFGQAFTHFEMDGNPIDERALVAFLDRQPLLEVVSSHNFMGGPIESILRSHGYRAFHLAMVRRPFQRLLSIYKYFRRTHTGHDLSRLAAQLDIQSYGRLLIERYPHMVDNPQVNILANDGFYGHAVCEDDLSRAWDRYSKYSLCAPVERYDESMVVLEYFNAPVYAPNGLNLAYVRQNVSEPIFGEENVKETLGEATFDWLRRLHEFDERLWSFANAELNRRICRVPEFDQRLASFKVRCQRLMAQAERI
jgi:hypothetical protein